MKKLKTIQLFLLFTIVPYLVNAQFKLTPEGFVSNTDSTHTFSVADVPNVKQADLYKRALIYLSAQYVSPKEVLSVIENETISINAIAKRAIKIKFLYLNPSWDVNYTIGFQFKDNKIKINQPIINKIDTYTGNIYRTVTISGSDGANNKEIYNGKGVLKIKDGKENLELFINNYIDNFIKAMIAPKQDNW